MSNRRRMPPEYVRSGRSAASLSSNFSSSSAARGMICGVGICPRIPTMRRFSRPVRFASTAAY